MSEPSNASLNAVVIGGLAAIAGALFSKLAENWGADRRAAAEARRQEDRDAKSDRDRLRDENMQLRVRLGALESICISNGIPLPPGGERVMHFREDGA